MIVLHLITGPSAETLTRLEHSFSDVAVLEKQLLLFFRESGWHSIEMLPDAAARLLLAFHQVTIEEHRVKNKIS